jgi:hypothetical protein
MLRSIIGNKYSLLAEIASSNDDEIEMSAWVGFKDGLGCML